MDKKVNYMEDKNGYTEDMKEIIEKNRNLNAKEFLELIRSKCIKENDNNISSQNSSGYGGYGLDII